MSIEKIQKDNISFKGMSSQSINRFLPELDELGTKKLSRIINHELPYDTLEVFNTNSNKIQHFRKVADKNYLLNSITYTGKESFVLKLKFLMGIVNKLKYGSYKGKRYWSSKSRFTFLLICFFPLRSNITFPTL